MIGFLKNNRIIQRSIFGVFVTVLFLLPVSISVPQHAKSDTSLSAHLSILVVHADGDIGVWIGTKTMALGGMFAYMGGKILTYGFDTFVFGMSDLLSGEDSTFEGTGLGGAINSLWTIVRDLCNLAFIFGFIYIGISTIIAPDSASVKRVLAQIIIGALLINFSLLITKIVIDFSNFTAVQIYTSLAHGQGDISTAFGNALGIGTFFGGTPDSAAFEQLAQAQSFWFFIVGFFMFVIAGFVFAAGGVLLIVRFVALTILMIFSPILFAATVFSGTAEHSKTLWQYLFRYAAFAPVYLLLLLFSIQILNSLTLTTTDDTGKGENLSAMASGDFTGTLTFILVILFLIFTLQVAQKLGVAGGTMAISMGNSLRKSGQRMVGSSTLGLGASLSRNTIGKAAHRRSNNQALLDKSSQSGFSGWMARRQLSVTKGLAGASFDARNVGGAGKNMGIGEGARGGYADELKKEGEKEKKFADSLGYDKEAAKEAEREGDQKIEDAQKEAQAAKDALATETKEDRDELIRISRELHSAVTEEERRVLTERINSLKAVIDTKTQEHKPTIDAAEGKVKEAESAKKEAVEKIKKARKEAYAEVVANPFNLPKVTNTTPKPIAAVLNFVNYGNKKVSEAVTKEKTPEQELIEELRESRKQAKKNQSGESGDNHH